MGKWTAGWNTPGYLPESEVVTFDDFDEACRYLYHEVGRMEEEDAEMADEAPARVVPVVGEYTTARFCLQQRSRTWMLGNPHLVQYPFTVYTKSQKLCFWVDLVEEKS